MKRKITNIDKYIVYIFIFFLYSYSVYSCLIEPKNILLGRFLSFIWINPSIFIIDELSLVIFSWIIDSALWKVSLLKIFPFSIIIEEFVINVASFNLVKSQKIFLV